MSVEESAYTNGLSRFQLYKVAGSQGYKLSLSSRIFRIRHRKHFDILHKLFTFLPHLSFALQMFGALRDDNAMMELLIKELKRNREYWHVTSSLAFEKIYRDREIRAMPEAESIHKFMTAARYLNGVALFDFNNSNFDSAEAMGGHHWQFFNHQPHPIAIGVDPQKLHGEILAFPENRFRTDPTTIGRIVQLPLLIEVIHVGSIPSTAWTRYLQITPRLSFTGLQVI